MHLRNIHLTETQNPANYGSLFSVHIHYQITTVPAVHHSLPEDHHIPDLEVVPEADAAAHGGDDFRSGYSVHRYYHRAHQTSLHKGQVGGLGVLRIRQHRLRS